MRSQTTTALYVVLMAAAIVAIDFLFFKNRFWQRLTVNVGIVLVFAAFYFRFLKHPWARRRRGKSGDTHRQLPNRRLKLTGAFAGQ
jgi:membrane protein implicated in regulation of membrane protease activity